MKFITNLPRKESKMKKLTFTKLICLVIVTVMLVSSLPVSAEDTATDGETSELLDYTIDFETGGDVSFVNGTAQNYHYKVTEAKALAGCIGEKFNKPDIAVLTATDYGQNYHCFIGEAPGRSGNYALYPYSTSSYFAVRDINKKLPDGNFAVSADFCLNLGNFTGTVPLIQWTRDDDLKGLDSNLTTKYALVSADADGHLVVNSEVLDATLSTTDSTTDSTTEWYNIKVEAEYTNKDDDYEISLYLNEVLVTTYTQSMPEPESGENGSYLIFFTRSTACKFSYVDNIHVYEWITEENEPEEDPEEDLDPNRLDTTIDFENLTADNYKENTWLNADNLAPLNIEGKTSFSTNNSSGKTRYAAIMDDKDVDGNVTTHGRVWFNASSSGLFTLHDLQNRLLTHDYTVSLDMKFTTFPDAATPLVSWLRGDSQLSCATTKLICINQYGRFCNDDVDLGMGVALDEWFNVVVKVSYLSDDFYRVTLYVNGELLSSKDTVITCKEGNADNSFIRILSVATSFKARFDNLQVYESDNAKIYPEKAVIWDVDFNNHESGTLMSIDTWNDYSSGYNVVRSNLGESAVIENGKLKLTPRSTDNCMDILMGGGNYDPMREGPVAISMKLNVNTNETIGSQKLLVWRRIVSDVESDPQKEAPVLVLENSALSFADITNVYTIDVNKDYDIKVILDGDKLVASLIVNGTTVIDSISIAAYASSLGMLGENLTYVTDDAGNMYKLPYSGFVYQQNGTDGDGNPVYVRRFVEVAGYGVETLRMFQASGSDATAEFYVDDFKVERVETDNVFISTDFTGWSNITDQSPLNTNQEKYGYFNFAEDNTIVPTIIKEADGNEYLSAYSAARMYITDPNNQLLHKNFELSFDLKFSEENATTTDVTKLVSFLGIVGSTISHTPFVTNVVTSNSLGKSRTFDYLLYTSRNGKLYDHNQEVLYDKLLENPWVNIRIVVEGDGAKWNTFKYYIDGKHVRTVEVSSLKSNTAYNSSIRFIPQGPFTMGLDNIKLSYITKTDDFILDFDKDYNSMLDVMGSEFKYPAIGSTRTDANGGTVISAQVMGEDDKYLRIDRTLLTADQEGSIVIDNSKYINEKEYIVETDFRISCEAGFGITPVTVVTVGNEKEFTPVQVRGAENTLYMSMRGAAYDLCDAAGNLLKVKTTEDTGFTKLAVLINENELDYTVYVDGNVAYYYYDGEYIPCVNIPIRYEDTGLCTTAKAGLRLMEIDGIRHNYSIIDIDRIAVTPAPSGLASDFKAIQSKIDISKQTFDLRFIAGIDSLYGNHVGYIVDTTYTDGTQKNAKKEFASHYVYSSIIDDTGTVNASELGSSYLFVMSITSLPITSDGISFNITPFVEHGGVRDLGAVESFIVNVENDVVVVK